MLQSTRASFNQNDIDPTCTVLLSSTDINSFHPGMSGIEKLSEVLNDIFLLNI